MAERRKLIQGVIEPTSAVAKEKDFVYAGSTRRAARSATQVVESVPRAPMTTRMRTDFLAKLKQVSLERQLDGVAPSTLQAIVEDAIGVWLRENGELPDD